LQAGLAALDAERGRIVSELTGAGAARKTLLMKMNGDSEIEAHDRRVSSLERDAERLDILEAELTSRLAALAQAERAVAWDRFLQQYSEALETFIQSVTVTANCRQALTHLRETATSMGCESLLPLLAIPRPQIPVDPQGIAQFAAGARADIAQARLPSPAPALVPIRFVRATSIWRTGEVAGFDAATARELIASGAAKPHSVPVETSPEPPKEPTP